MDTLYHVTFSENVDKIKEEGLLPFNNERHRNYEWISDNYRTERENAVFAFKDINHAKDWIELMKDTFDNKPLHVIEFEDDLYKYVSDTNIDMRERYPSAVYKRDEPVKPEQIRFIYADEDFIYI